MSLFGTIGYMAPEIIKKDLQYDHRIDMYSLGVILFAIVTRTELFVGSVQQIQKKTVQSQPSFDHPAWSNYSSDLVHFIKNLLSKDKNERMSAEQALSHHWIDKKAKNSWKLA